MGLHRRRVWEIAKGFRGRARNCIKIARQQAEKALQHSYRCRHERASEKRALWITRINAAAREHGLKYSALVSGLRQENVGLNRMMLAELAAHEPHSFAALVEQVRFMRPALPTGFPQAPGAPGGGFVGGDDALRRQLAARITVGSLPGPDGSGGGSGGGSIARGGSQ